MDGNQYYLGVYNKRKRKLDVHNVSARILIDRENRRNKNPNVKLVKSRAPRVHGFISFF